LNAKELFYKIVMLKRLDICISLENAIEESYHIINLVKPDWKKDEIACKVFDSGITNKMLGFSLKENKNETVLVRVNGSGTEEFLDRKAEVESFSLLSKHDCAPQLYCIFKNGLCYEFVPGATLTTKSVCDAQVARLVAREMVKMHAIPNHENSKPVFVDVFRKFLKLASSEKESGIFCSLDELASEVNEMEEMVSKHHYPVVFCHNDLLVHNIVHNSDEQRIRFIDYEYASFNYQAFDIANHFAEFAGVDEVDYNLYPNKQQMMAWLRNYIEENNEFHHIKSTDEEIESQTSKLYEQVNQFSMTPHLMWGLWALVQAKCSQIDFDYKGYAVLRLTEYFNRKKYVKNNS